MLVRLMSSCLVSLLLFGCGLQTTVTPAPRPSTGPYVPGPSVTPVGDQVRGSQTLEAFRQRLRSARGFSTELGSYSEGYYYGGTKSGTFRRASSRSRFLWARSTRLRADVLEAANPILRDAILVTEDGRNLKVKASGLLSLVPIRMDDTDARLATNRNFSFRDNVPFRHMERLSGAQARWSLLGSQGSGESERLTVAVDGVPRLDPEITREVLVLDGLTLGPVQHQMFVNGRCVVSNTFRDFRWDPSISDTSFRL